MKLADAVQHVDQIVADHHDAYLLELFGEAGSGLSTERIKDLLERGIARKDAIRDHLGIVPAGQRPYDPVEFLRGIGKYLTAHPDMYEALKNTPADQWAPIVDRVLRRLHEENLKRPGFHHIAEAEHFDDTQAPEDSPDIPTARGKPRVREFTPKPEGLDVPVTAQVRGMSPMDQAAYRQAITRAGEYCKGLGNVWSEALQQVVREEWGEEAEPQKVPLPATRKELVDTIRKEVAAAWTTHRDPKMLASALARATGDFTRDWRRIALTELQAAYNDGVAIDAVQRYGKEAQVARLPESRACKDCRRLLLDASGTPILWSVQALARNGTNVGRKKQDWLATLFPIHPKCRCGTIAVPPGYEVQTSGILRKKT